MAKYREIIVCVVFVSVNLAFGKKTVQISNDKNTRYQSKNAVDGIKTPTAASGKCSVTGKAKMAWWSVDLGKRYKVNSVLIATRKEGRKYTINKHLVVLIKDEYLLRLAHQVGLI